MLNCIYLFEGFYIIVLFYCASVVCVILIDCQASGVTAVLDRVQSFLSGSRTSAGPGSPLMAAQICADPDCDVGLNATVSLGCTK